MAKLTVYFKSKEIESYLFGNKVIHIGRDDSNDIQIDSLAVAPAHAAIVIHDHTATVKQLNERFPLIVNGKETKEQPLGDGDIVSIGKHDLVFHHDQAQPEDQPQVAAEPESLTMAQGQVEHHDDHEQHHAHAGLQVLDGPNIGKVVALKKAMTRLGNEQSGMVVITRRKEGFFVAALKNNGDIQINGQALKEHYVKLCENDILRINNISLLFFLG